MPVSSWSVHVLLSRYRDNVVNLIFVSGWVVPGENNSRHTVLHNDGITDVEFGGIGAALDRV